MRQVTVVIPNYNGTQYLIPCLSALYENSALEFDVIVVDNHSVDGSIEEAKKAFPEVIYHLLDQNYGFSKAVNEGIKLAKTSYVFLLNNDAEIKKGCIEALLKTIKKDDRIFSVEAKMLQYGDAQLIDSAGTFYNALGWAFARGKDQLDSKYDKKCRTFAARAGAALYRKDLLHELGLFDETYFAYLEDIDIGYRAKIHGYQNVYEPSARVLHAGSGTSGSRYNAFKVRYSARNNIYLIHKNMPLWQKLWNAPLLVLGFGVKFIFFCKKGLGKAYAKGIKEGFLLCKKTPAMRYEKRFSSNYKKIQFELWRNVIRKRW